MLAWLKNVIEVVLWWWVGRPTSKMEQEWADEAAKYPGNPRGGQTSF